MFCIHSCVPKQAQVAAPQLVEEITITDLGKAQGFAMSSEHKGFCDVCVRLVENTANDSLSMFLQQIPPGKTGNLYCGEIYDVKPFTFQYIP